MNEQTTISKNREVTSAQDYQFLRQEGLKYIESLSQQLWTDYNAHDPGITMLEALAYVITELGYRTNFEITDLVTGSDGLIQNGTFFTARNILSNAPVTELDYRKLLIDIPGIANAWLVACTSALDQDGFPIPHAAEQNIFINVLEDKLSFANKDKYNTPLPKLWIRGLGKVIVELDSHPLLGDLNSTTLHDGFVSGSNYVELEIIPEFHHWNHTKANLLKYMNKPSKIKDITVTAVNDHLIVKVKRSSNPAQTLRLVLKPNNPSEILLAKAHFNTEATVAGLIQKLLDKKTIVDQVYTEVHHRLHANRNFTEDYISVETVELTPIAFCVDIDLASDADVVEVMAALQIVVENLLNPPLHFYTLSQLLEQGKSSADIFVGPKLIHGFLNDEELVKAQLPTEIHASDIIAEWMKIPGVLSIRNFLMTAYDTFGTPIPNAINKEWRLPLNGAVKPILHLKKSKLLLFKNRVPFLLNESQQLLVAQKVQFLKGQNATYKLLQTKIDLEIPKGTYYPLFQYQSVQEEMPGTYGLGYKPVSDNSTALRKAQVKQLKAYLHFFDQQIANLFSQLYHAKSLLDIPTIHRTYFPQYLEKNPNTNEDFFSKEVYTNDFEWNVNNGERKEDVSLFENQSTFQNRRNRALDHLIARFSENFNAYVLMMHQIANSNTGFGNLTVQPLDMIKDKQHFLKQYADISYHRGLGMQYLNPPVSPYWDTDIRAGYDKRVAALLGINDIRLRDIVTETTVQTQWTLTTSIGSIVFEIVDSSVALSEKWNWAQDNLANNAAYFIAKHAGKFYIYMGTKGEKVVRIDNKFNSFETALSYFNEMIQSIYEFFENFYCIEHILLRPFPFFTDDEKDLFTVCLKDECYEPSNGDPYSFKATIVLPGYIGRFRNLNFRIYAEQIFRQEAPAHCLLKICWVNRADFLSFQNAYKAWLNHYGKFRTTQYFNNPSSTVNTKALKLHRDLLLSIKALNTIYPVGNLFDCVSSEISNPILLGNTSLGTI
nr:hypothetical protein [Chitinophagaceae bacterium]